MIEGGHNGQRQSKLTKAKKNTQAKVCGKNGRTRTRGRANRRKPCLQAGRNCSGSTLPLEAKILSSRKSRFKGSQARSEAKGRSPNSGDEIGDGVNFPGAARDLHRTASHEKKESLGLEGPLFGRHLTQLKPWSLSKSTN